MKPATRDLWSMVLFGYPGTSCFRIADNECGCFSRTSLGCSGSNYGSWPSVAASPQSTRTSTIS